MKIEIIVLLFSLYTSASAFWFWSATPTAEPRQDCRWQDHWTEGLCLEVSGKPYPYGRTNTREKFKAKGGGKDCTGPSSIIVECSRNEYVATVLLRTVTAQLSGGGSSSKRTLNTKPKNCVTDLKDDNGNVVMSGRNCPQGKRKKRALDTLESLQSRAKRATDAPPPPTPPPPTPPPILSTKNRDVLFLLDESGSVGPQNFKKVLRMARAITNSFCGPISIGKSSTRVGVLTFNKEQHPQIDFDEFFKKADLLHEMEHNVKYYGYPSAGATCLVETLEYTRTKMLIPGRGARNNIAGTERLVILITDGCANCVSNSKLKSNLNNLGIKYTADGVPIITFLIADKPTYCFKIMKGLSDGSQCYQQFWAKDWAAFGAMTVAIEKSPCMDAWMIGPSC